MKPFETEDLTTFLGKYSFDDLATSFFVLNLWLPNIASPVKSQFLYVVLESVFDKLPAESRIHGYDEFQAFAKELIALMPSFPMLEDYVPEADWGEIKYFFDKKYYRVFYGGDLSNSYEYCYSFETIHTGLDDFYLQTVDRSPIKEFKFFLELQDTILAGIPQALSRDTSIGRGDFSIPEADFWTQCRAFLNDFNAESLDQDIIKQYTRDLESEGRLPLPSEKQFQSNAHRGKNCFYFFLKKAEKIYPVLPRKHLAVIFDTWGEILFEHYQELGGQDFDPLVRLNIEFAEFVTTRTRGKTYFNIVSALDSDFEVDDTIFATALVSESKLILVHILPPFVADGHQQKALDELPERFRRVEELLKTKPPKLALLTENRMMTFEPIDERQRDLDIVLVACVPFSTTYPAPLKLPEDFKWEVMGLDQILGLLDECETTGELSEFLDYKRNLPGASSMMTSLVSALDLFGSFKDSNSVLVEGATEYTDIMIDPHWGSSHRFRSLAEFWSAYPELTSFGHPRGWSFTDERQERVELFRSRTMFAYFRFILVDQVKIVINTPVDLMTFEQGEITELLMDGLADAIDHYRNQVDQILANGLWKDIHILFFPASLVRNESKLNHLRHLLPENDRWAMDATRLGRGRLGIRIVLDDLDIPEKLLDATDRELQVSLLIDVLKQCVPVASGEDLSEPTKDLEKEKTKKNRFRTFKVENRVSFPRFSQSVVPDTREYKLAAKKVAEVAKANDILPEAYDEKKSKELINRLIDGVVATIDTRVGTFDYGASIRILLVNIDSLINNYEQDSLRMQNSLDQEVEYQRESSSAENQLKFVEQHSCYRYLIEKFVQIEPVGGDVFSDQDLAELLALVGSVLHLYFISDHIHYGIYPAKLSVSHDYLIDFEQPVDIGDMQRLLAEVQAQIRLGMIGNKDDIVRIQPDQELYLDQLDEAFRKDLHFSFRDLINSCQVLARWAHYRSLDESQTSYNADIEEIRTVLEAAIDGFNATSTEAILEFLTLDSKKILMILGNPQPAKDLPVWEHRKRSQRYCIRPIIKVDKDYCWGPFSVERSGQIWSKVLNDHKLPTDIPARNIKSVLDASHQTATVSLQNRIQEVVKRFTPFVKTEVSPFHRGLSPRDIGDIDVFALSSDKRILFNIESKLIDQPHSNKDMKRVAEKIFGRDRPADGTLANGYLKKVVDRDAYLRKNGRELAEMCWGKLDSDLEIISLFVTSEPHWFTTYPVVSTDVIFVEVRLLEDELRKQLNAH